MATTDATSVAISAGRRRSAIAATSATVAVAGSVPKTVTTFAIATAVLFSRRCMASSTDWSRPVGPLSPAMVTVSVAKTARLTAVSARGAIIGGGGAGRQQMRR